ncbi:MAG: serine/threonine protein kinase, partial [Pyrinomonadaceae bacterium]|nr:serine/threonine protein kinase [Phycisphaerales bacterium]
MSARTPEQDRRRRQAEEIFFAAVETPDSERELLLDKLCDGDSSLRAEVLSLLTVHDGHTGILDLSPVNGVQPGDLEKVAGAALTRPHEKEEGLSPGARFGSYRIEREIGVGGMGFVYIAKQDRPRRTVALKLIRRYLATPALLRRFELEADILARLQHPGIAQIYEAGSADDGRGMRPFIAMELVENGKNLTEFADARKLSTTERLELVIRVCDALHHAHQRGVIHRDLKPGNILVDEHSQPKILDFGVARAQGPDYTGTPMTTLHTNVGQIIGTLPYMSPEQVGGDPAEIDVRSDVYSVGVILYQLLTGRLPHDVNKRSFTDAARLIRETLPAKLSSINRTLRGDLDTIVGMTLSKERSRRYQSAYDLSEDLRRYIKGEPILARRDSALYILRKSMRRYKSLVAASVVGLLSLIGFVIYAGYQVSITSALAKRETQAKLSATYTADELRRTLYSANIGFAQAAYFGSDVERMRRVLNECPPDLRGWEWRFLHRISDTCALKFQAFNPSWGAAWLSPASGQILTYCSLPEVKVWSPAAQRGAAEPRILRIESPLAHVAMSPDGTKALLSAQDLSCTMFDPMSGKPLWTSQVPSIARWSGHFTPDNKHIVWSVPEERKLAFINAATG